MNDNYVKPPKPTSLLALIGLLIMVPGISVAQLHHEDFPITDRPVNALLAAEDENLLFIGGQFRYIGESTGHGVFYRKSDLSRVRNTPKINRSMMLATTDALGGYILWGEFRRVGSFDRRRMARIRSNLTVDPDFDPSPGSSTDFIRKHDGRMFAIGHNWIAPVTSDGIGVRITPEVIDFNVTVFDLSGSYIYVAARYSDDNGTIREGIVKVHTASGLILNPEVHIPVNRTAVQDIVIDNNDLFVLMHGRIFKYDPLTLEQIDWDYQVGNVIHEFIVGGDGQIYLGGRFTGIIENGTVEVVRIDRYSGNLDGWYPQVDGSIYSFYLTMGSSYLVMIGDFNAVDGVPVKDFVMYSTGLAQLVPGARVRNFHPGIPFDLYNDRYESETTFAETVGHYFLGGGFFMADATKAGPFVVFDLETSETIPLPYIMEGRVNSFVRDGDLLLIGGDIRFWENGYENERYGVIAFDIPSRRLASWSHNLYHAAGIQTIAATAGHVFVGGDFYYINEADNDVYTDLYRDNLFSINRSNGAITSWAPEVGGEVEAMLVHGDVLYIAGRFESVNGQPRSRLAAFDANTGELLDWNPGADGSVRALAANATTLFVGGSFEHIGEEPRSRIAAFKLADGTLTPWTAETERVVRSLTISGNVLFTGAGTASGSNDDSRLRAYRLDLDTNNRLEWPTEMNYGVQAIHYSPVTNTAIVGGDFWEVGDDIIRHGLALIDGPDMSAVSIPDERAEQQPATFTLHQNYPNPFNPGTEIRFTLPEAGAVQLHIYDITGRRVAVLLEGHMGAGTHGVRFDASGLAGGVYLYRLRAGERNATGKMLLIK
jgi:hypothetical protein